MTQEERIELLRKVAEVAPKEMGAKLISSEGVKFSRDNGQTTAVLTADDDMFDAEAIIAMLDAMEARDLEGLGPEVCVELTGSKGEYHCRRWVCPENDDSLATVNTQGDTRAEAVARAFVEVFEVKP